MLVPNQVDLATVNPVGRFDVLAYRGVETYVKQLEQQHGIIGLWETIAPQVNQLIVGNITGLEIPLELSIMLRLIQANLQKKVTP